MNKQVKGSLILLLAAFLWGIAFIAQSTAIKYMDAFSVLYLRSLVGVIALLPFYIVSKIKEKKNKIIRNNKKIDYVLGPLFCGLCLCLGSIFQQIGMKSVSAGKSGFITSMYILLVPLFSLFLKKKCGINVYFSLVIAVIGLLLLSFDFSSGLNFTTGDLLILIGTIFFALQILVIDYYSNKLNTFYLSIGQLLTQGIIMFIAELIKGFDSAVFINMFNIESIVAILFLGIFSSAVAYTLQMVGQKYVNPTVASLILSLESVFSALSSVIIYQFYKFSDIDQNLSLTEVLGCLILFSAVIFSQLPSYLFVKKLKEEKLIKNKIDEMLKNKDMVVVAIDGKSASGKTHLARNLKLLYNDDCFIFHMDDFYKMNNGNVNLLSHDGNINFEYLKENILDKLKEEAFTYSIFDCKNQKEIINNKYEKKKIIIIEGSYSLHPSLGKYYDLSIYLDIDNDFQDKRLKRRNKNNYLNFKNNWIVLENNYQDFYKINDSCDLAMKIKKK